MFLAPLRHRVPGPRSWARHDWERLEHYGLVSLAVFQSCRLRNRVKRPRWRPTRRLPPGGVCRDEATDGKGWFGNSIPTAKRGEAVPESTECEMPAKCHPGALIRSVTVILNEPTR
jgi:hypothetical protein